MLDDYSAWFEKNEAKLLENFFTFLRFPSVSTDPTHRNDLLACKDWLHAYMESIGLKVEIWETSGHPTVFGSYEQGGGPTLLFYGHYDVQPAPPLDEWKSPPFEPEIRERVVYARGAIDNKGQGFYTLAAIQAFLECAKEKNINIKVLIEGEEEIGSPGLEGILPDKRKKLAADHIFIVDAAMYAKGIPAVTLGIRGATTINVTVKNSTTDLHSGVYGGIVLNPARALVTALGKMWNEEGKICIPNFYEGVRALSQEEHDAFDWDVDPTDCAALFDVKAFKGEKGFSLLESNWIRPTLEINGMESGYTGEGTKTIIPSKAMAKLSCRLVPNQNPEHVICSIETFLKKNLAEGLELSVEKGFGAPAFMTSPHFETVEKALKAYEGVYHTKCRRQLCGATIPIAGRLFEVCGGGLVMIGMGLQTDKIHAPNECFSLDRFKEGFLSITQILEIFSSRGFHGSNE
ncbi:MAG: dipeptidase [Simkaniaceae bacterium]|nr:dipeptidase [Simkaniaceae bacterium]